MKKILIFALALMIFFTLATSVMADELTTDAPIDTDTAEVTTDQTAQEIVEETTNRISTILGISGTVGIGAIIIAAITFFVKNLSSVKGVVTSLASVYSNIFSKDGKVENIPQAFKTIDNDIKDLAKGFNDELAKVQEELSKEKECNEQFKHILSVFIINSNYVNPYAKAELIQLICGDKKFGTTIEETLNNVDEVVTKSKEMEDKPDTPFLDKLVNDVAETPSEV
jgi:hypothetical protein